MSRHVLRYFSLLSILFLCACANNEPTHIDITYHDSCALFKGTIVEKENGKYFNATGEYYAHNASGEVVVADSKFINIVGDYPLSEVKEIRSSFSYASVDEIPLGDASAMINFRGYGDKVTKEDWFISLTVIQLDEYLLEFRGSCLY